MLVGREREVRFFCLSLFNRVVFRLFRLASGGCFFECHALSRFFYYAHFGCDLAGVCFCCISFLCCFFHGNVLVPSFVCALGMHMLVAVVAVASVCEASWWLLWPWVAVFGFFRGPALRGLSGGFLRVVVFLALASGLVITKCGWFPVPAG